MESLPKGGKLELAQYVNVNDVLSVNIIAHGSGTYKYCCYGMDDQGNIVDGLFVFEGKTSSPAGDVVFVAGKQGLFNVKLALVSQSVKRLVFVIYADHGSIKSVSSGQVNIGKNKTAPQCLFAGSALPDTPVLSVVEIYRHSGIWKLYFRAESLEPDHAGPVLEKLRKPSAVVPAPPDPNSSVSPQRGKSLQDEIPWVVHLLPTIGKQSVPPKCFEELKLLFWRHLLWTLWFWVPFGAILGWIHLALRSHNKRYVLNAVLYSLVLLVPYSNGFWQVNIFAWFIGLIHCYGTFHMTFRYMVESTDGKHYEPSMIEDKFNLNTVNFKTFEKYGGDDVALPVLVNRHKRGQFPNMPVFLTRLANEIPASRRDALSRGFDAVEETNHTKFLSKGWVFVIPFLLLCLIGGTWGIYTISPPEVKEMLVPQIQQQVYTLFGWDFYKIVQGTGSGATRAEALRQAKTDALGNALGEQLIRKETGKSGIVTISDDEGDTNKAEMRAQEDYEKQVEGKISDVEILNESQDGGLFHMTIRAKVLMNKKEPAK